MDLCWQECEGADKEHRGLWQYDELLPGSCFLYQEVLPDALLGAPLCTRSLQSRWHAGPHVPGLLSNLPLSGPPSPHLADRETG